MLCGMLLDNKIINMNNIINTFLLAGDKFMPEIHLRQPQFVDKACFQHDSAYADHKDLINRTKSDKVLRDKAYNIASNPEYDGYQRGLANMVCTFFDKKSMGSGEKKLKNSSLILVDQLHKPVIKKFKKIKVYSQFKDLADMQSLSKKNKGIKYLLCAIDLFSKYAFAIPLKDKK